MRRDYVASTLIRRHFGTKCPLGYFPVNGDKNQRNTYLKKAVDSKTDKYQKGSKGLRNDYLEQEYKPIKNFLIVQNMSSNNKG